MISDTEFTENEKAEIAALDKDMTDRRAALGGFVLARLNLDARQAEAVKALQDAEQRLSQRVELAFKLAGVDLAKVTDVTYHVDTHTQTITKVPRAGPPLRAVGG